jgi:hypothetical protein
MANIERLTQLRRVIEEAPEDRLHMRAWSEKAPCGTAHCAAGWAALDPWFQVNTEILKHFFVGASGRVHPREYSSDAFGGLAQIFAISGQDARALFGGGLHDDDSEPHAVTKGEVLKNIDALLMGKRAEFYEAAKDI